MIIREQSRTVSHGRESRAGLMALATLCVLGASPFASAQSDPVVFSFATVGDSRQDLAAPDPTTLLAEGSQPGAASQFGGLPAIPDLSCLRISSGPPIREPGLQSRPGSSRRVRICCSSTAI